MNQERDNLIDFNIIEKNLEHVHQINRGIQAIPINKIVGSLGRYQDFTDKFLPHREHISAKYENVKHALLSGKILPPIKVYQVLDNYFVIDGHHRVTVAKNELQAEAIDAEVIEIQFDLELDPNKKYTYNTEHAKDFLIKIEEDVFQKKTLLRNSIIIRPIKVTELTSYAKLYEEIKDFRKNYNQGELAKKHIVYSSLLWYEIRFLPAVNTIINEDILSNFPGRTYTDLYIWIQLHKYYLSQQAGYDVGFDFTKEDFVKKFKRLKFLDLLPPIIQDIIKNIKNELNKK